MQEETEKLLKSRSVFQTTYRNNYEAFVHDCFHWKDGESPTDYQNEILASINDNCRKYSVRGPHGLGKTALAAWFIIGFVLTHDGDCNWKLPTTASSWTQLSKFLWPEIHLWLGRVRWDRIGRRPFVKNRELLDTMLKLKTGMAYGMSSTKSENIEGGHADKMFFIFDEAKAIPIPTWDSIEGAFSTGDCYAFAISTPGDSLGRFFDIHRRAPGFESWSVRHVKIDEALRAGRVSEEWVKERKRQWGEDSPIYQARVLGEFPDQMDDTLISLNWIEQARFNETKPGIPQVAGQDVARFGSDDSIWILREGDAVTRIKIVHGQDTMKITGWMINQRYKTNIDEIGVGAGVVDRAKELNFDCTGINVGCSARNKEDFVNLRTELFWCLRERFKAGNIDLSRLTKADYDRLSGELTNLKYKYTSRGQVALESKEDMKKRLGHSPDMADGLSLAFAGDNIPEPSGVTMTPAADAFLKRRTR